MGDVVKLMPRTWRWVRPYRAGFKPIWPISSNPAPRQRRPRAPSTHQSKLALSIEAAWV